VTNCASRKATLVLAAVVAAAAAAASTPATAAAGDRTRAAQVMRTLDRLAARSSVLNARSTAAGQRLGVLRLELGRANAQERLDQANLTATRAMLASALVGQYKAGGTDPALFVFSAGSFSDMVDRIEELNRIGATEASAITLISTDSVRVRADAAAVKRGQQAVAATIAQLDTERAAVDRAIAARRAVLASINARIRARLAAEHRRRARLAHSVDSSGGGPTVSTGHSVFYGDVTWYGPGFAGDPTASGEPFDPTKLTAASPWLPFNTMLRVTSTVTDRSVVVRVNDRGPFGHGVLDLSQHAANVIGLSGWQRCRIVILSQP
jgi:peptidoglycan lytic transglycosylase